MPLPAESPTLDDLRAAAERIRPLVHRTPVLTSSSLDALIGARLFFKAENFQRAGAFKMRGAANAVSLLGPEARRGVATHSSGNHGGALALAARQRGVPCWVVMPEGATQSKIHAVQAYGATIVYCEPTQASREATARRVIEETGATFVHPYDDPRIIAGQGTVALELMDQVEDLDLIVAPVGGGGLLSGTTLAVHGVSPGTRVLGAEPSGADDAQRSLAAGRITPVDQVETFADGLRATIGQLPFGILSHYKVPIVTATDPQIEDAIQLLWGRLKTVVEPSGAVPLAALFREPFDLGDLRIGVILSGGNVDYPRLLPDSYS